MSVKKYKNRNFRLTEWQIAMLEKLVTDEYVKQADDPSRYAADLQLLYLTIQRARGITVTKSI